MEHNVIEDNFIFQGEDVLIIGNGFDLDLELKTSYGDYMKLPPKDKQVAKDPAVVWEF